MDLTRRHPATGLSDRVALGLTKLPRFFADASFAKRYGHRDVNHDFAEQLSGTAHAHRALAR